MDTSPHWLLEQFGLKLRVLAPREMLETCLLPGWTLEETSPGAPADHTLEVREEGLPEQCVILRNDQVFAYTNSPWQTLQMLDQALHITLAEFSRQGVFFHAGTVAYQGYAILLPGRSMAGKSTLTRALVDAGAQFFSDEFAVADEDGRVRSYPKALSQRRAGERPEIIDARALGWSPQLSPVPAGVIAAVHYSPGNQARRLERVSGADGVFALMDNCVPAQTSPEKSLRTAAALAGRAICLRGQRGEAAEFAAELLDVIGEISAPAPPG